MTDQGLKVKTQPFDDIDEAIAHVSDGLKRRWNTVETKESARELCIHNQIIVVHLYIISRSYFRDFLPVSSLFNDHHGRYV